MTSVRSTGRENACPNSFTIHARFEMCATRDTVCLSDARDKRSSLHAKCVAIDRRVSLITSANFTEAAQQRNIEAGVIVRYPLFVERLVGYFEGLRASGQLVSIPPM